MADGRIKITGYYTPSPAEHDPDDATGLTSAAYDDLVTGEHGGTLSLMDLEDVELELEK